jgi:MFS superfamily sulfate permease-like transporter
LKTLKAFVDRHPQLTAWFVLAVGMVVILLWSAKGVGLLPAQMLALVVATVLVAGLCVWIIGWEDEQVDTVPSQGTPKNEGGS